MSRHPETHPEYAGTIDTTRIYSFLREIEFNLNREEMNELLRHVAKGKDPTRV